MKSAIMNYLVLLASPSAAGNLEAREWLLMEGW